MAEARTQWKSKFGFILAASGSAIGLGNIVMFSANAYKYGGGAFYLPYFLALFVVGIPVMIAEFGLGGLTRQSFPLAMRQAGGRFGEFAGWFAILNAGFISMFYITILAWVVGMAVGGSIHDIPATFGVQAESQYFEDMIGTWGPMLAVLLVWGLNFLLVSKGTKTIEPAVKVFVPLMWIAMCVLVIVGCSLPGGFEGVKVLFTPKLEVLGKPEVWGGAMSQMFFTLTLGFGVMSAYSSYLPDRSDHSHNAITTSLMNCGFEWIAGIAVFSMLFAFSQVPSSSTLGMMFYVVPKGIAHLPFGAQLFMVSFFLLLLIAGLTSSISLVEAVVAAAQDKFGAKRIRTLTICCVVGCVGSLLMAIPSLAVKDGNVSLGLWLLDLTNHWSFDYGLLIAGLIECLVIGWGIGARRIRAYINERSRFRLGVWFDWLIKLVLPALLGFLLVTKFNSTDGEKGLYGHAQEFAPETGFLLTLLKASPYLVLGAWVFGGIGGAWLLSGAKGQEQQAVADHATAEGGGA